MLAACPAPTVELPAGELSFARSGERLHARFFEGDGGRAFVDFFDQETGQGCLYTETGSGYRCLPRPISEQYYATADCREAMAISMPGAPRYVLGRSSVYRLGGERPGAQLYMKIGDACESLSGPSWGVPRPVEEELSFDDFVRGEETELDEGLRLARLGVLGEDGSWSPGGWRDRLFGIDCNPGTPGGAGLCKPLVYIGNMERDAQCARPVIWSNEALAPYVVYRDSADDSAEELLYPVLGPVAVSEVLHQLPGGGCEASAHGPVLPASQVPYALGEPQSLDHLARLDRATQGDGALRSGGYRTEDGRFGVQPSLGKLGFGLGGSTTSFSADLVLADDRRCLPIAVGDTLRCLPVAAYTWSNSLLRDYSDDACTERALFTVAGQDGLALLDSGFSFEPYGLILAGELHELGALVPDAKHFVESNGSCVEVMSLGAPIPLEAHRLGPAADASAFPVLSLGVE